MLERIFRGLLEGKRRYDVIERIYSSALRGEISVDDIKNQIKITWEARKKGIITAEQFKSLRPELQNMLPETLIIEDNSWSQKRNLSTS